MYDSKFIVFLDQVYTAEAQLETEKSFFASSKYVRVNTHNRKRCSMHTRPVVCGVSL